MKRTLVAFFILIIQGCAVEQTIDSAVQDAKSMIESHEQYAKAADLDMIMTNVSEDVVVLVPGIPLVEGKKAFREFYDGLLKMGNLDFDHDYHGSEVIGNTVVLHGVANGSITPKDSESNEFANNFVLVLKYDSDGKIKFWRVAFASSSQ